MFFIYALLFMCGSLYGLNSKRDKRVSSNQNGPTLNSGSPKRFYQKDLGNVEIDVTIGSKDTAFRSIQYEKDPHGNKIYTICGLETQKYTPKKILSIALHAEGKNRHIKILSDDNSATLQLGQNSVAMIKKVLSHGSYYGSKIAKKNVGIVFKNKEHTIPVCIEYSYGKIELVSFEKKENKILVFHMKKLKKETKDESKKEKKDELREFKIKLLKPHLIQKISCNFEIKNNKIACDAHIDAVADMVKDVVEILN